MKLDSLHQCLIATPVLHLPKVNDFVSKYQNCFEIHENIAYHNLKELLARRSDIKSLLVNPNAQGFVIDHELLVDSSLQCINTCSTGLNHINLEECSKLGIKIYSLKNDLSLINNLPSTSELAFGMMLGLFRNYSKCNNAVLQHDWNYKSVMGHQLEGASIGVLGYGRLGKIFCRQLSGFNVKVSVCDSSSKVSVPNIFNRVDIGELFSESDAVAIHIHSTPENKKLINSDLLSRAKKGMYLINTSRGDLVDEQVIAHMLQSGHLGGYATDVLATEFSCLSDSPILQLHEKGDFNIMITPHVGGMTFEGQEKAYLYALSKFSYAD